LVGNFKHINQGYIFNPELGIWVTYEQYQASQQSIGQIFTEDDPAQGADEPIIYIVAYESFGCPYCADNQADLKAMMEKFGSITKLVFKDFPTEGMHANVFDAHLAAGCAQDQDKFWEYHDVLFANQNDFSKGQLKQYAADLNLNMTEFNSCFDNEEHSQEIRQDYAQGVNLGAIGTPSYIINGQLVPGAIPFEVWEQIVGFILQQE
jgi:protein-disulfide isomerase